MLERLANLQIKHPYFFAIFIIIITLLAGYIAVDLAIDPSFSVLVSEYSEYNTNNRILTNAFGRNDAIIVRIQEDKESIVQNGYRVTDPKTLEYIEELKTTFEQSQYVVGSSGPVFDDNERIAQIFLGLQIPETSDGFARVLEELEYYKSEVGEPIGITTTITGLPVLLNRIVTLLITDSLVTVLITLVFVFLIALWYARDLLYAGIILIVPILSLVGLGAAMVLLDIDISLTLASIGVLVLGLGVDYSIHIATHYRRARAEHESHKQALLHTINELKLPITASFITTLAGFSALLFGVSPSSQAQGFVLSIAIIIIYLLTFLVFPVLVTLAQNRITIKESPTFKKIQKVLAKIAIYQAHHAKMVVLLVGIITVIMFYGLTQVTFSTSNSNWIPDGDPVATSFREITYSFGDQDTISLILIATKGDLRNVQTARDANKLTELFEGIYNVEEVTSPFKNISYESSELHNTLTYERANQFNKDFTVTRIDVSSQNIGQDEAGNSILLSDMRRLLNQYPIHNAKVSLYGDAVRFEELGASLEQDAGTTTMIGLVLVFLTATLIYASLRIGLLALIPIIIAIIWALGLMGFFKVPFTSLSTGIISLVLGIGVDFSIHIVDGIKKFSQKMHFDDAIAKTLEGTGSAIVLSSITTCIGFLALTFASLLGTQRLGWSLAFSIIAVFFVTIMLVPAVMSFGKTYKQYTGPRKLK